ncbi:MAG: hypothetical protein ACREAD_00660 [Nitrosopumilaceae archaeon]
MSKSHVLNKKGRPSVSDQAQIRKILRPYYESGLSAYYTSGETGIDIKTVCKYYNEWSEQIEEAETSDFLERQKRDRIQIIISYDTDIVEMTKLLDEVNAEIENFQKEKKLIPRHLSVHKLEIIKFRSLLKEKKAAFIMQPTMDEALEKKIREKIKEHEQSRTSS